MIGKVVNLLLFPPGISVVSADGGQFHMKLRFFYNDICQDFYQVYTTVNLISAAQKISKLPHLFVPFTIKILSVNEWMCLGIDRSSQTSR